jgi:hypothetical protein
LNRGETRPYEQLILWFARPRFGFIAEAYCRVMPRQLTFHTSIWVQINSDLSIVQEIMLPRAWKRRDAQAGFYITVVSKICYFDTTRNAKPALY